MLGLRTRRCATWNRAAAQAEALDKIAAELAATAGPALPGTITVRRLPAAACRTAPATPTRPGCTAPMPMDPQDRRQDHPPDSLPPPELAEYQPLFENSKKLRALLTELQDLTLEIIEEGGQHRGAAKPAGPEEHDLRKAWAEPA